MFRPRVLNHRPFLELVIGYLLILLVVWTPNPVQRVFFWLSFVYLVGVTLLSRNSGEELGFGVRRVRRAVWIIAAVFAGCVVAIGIAESLGLLQPLFGPKPIPIHVWGYLVWALLQQFILQDFVLLRLIRITNDPLRSVLIAGLLFAVAHLPNPVLTVATLLWGTAACVIFLRYRTLYVLTVAHWMLGLCVAVTVPGEINRHMRVGLGYVRYHTPKGAASLVPFVPEARQSDPVYIRK